MDIQSDNSHALLFKISTETEIPEYVLKSSPMNKEACDKKPGALFADERRRAYPICSKAETWLSGACFAKTAHEDGYSDDEYRNTALRIIDAAEKYGIKEDVERSMEKLSEYSHQKPEIDESCFGDPENNGFPMFDSDGVKKACAYLEENMSAYGWKKRMGIARRIMSKAAEFGVKATDMVRRESGLGYPRLDTLAENIMLRAQEAERRGMNKIAGNMVKITKIICTADPSEIMSNLMGIRSMASNFDEMSGLDRMYGKGILPPSAFVNDISEEEGKEYLEDAVPIGGDYMSAKALAKLPDEVYRSVLPDKMIDDMKSEKEEGEEEGEEKEEEGEEKEEEGEEKEEEGKEKEEEGEETEKDPKKVKVAIMKLSSADSNHLASSIADYLSGR